MIYRNHFSDQLDFRTHFDVAQEFPNHETDTNRTKRHLKF